MLFAVCCCCMLIADLVLAVFCCCVLLWFVFVARLPLFVVVCYLALSLLVVHCCALWCVVAVRSCA